MADAGKSIFPNTTYVMPEGKIFAVLIKVADPEGQTVNVSMTGLPAAATLTQSNGAWAIKWTTTTWPPGSHNDAGVYPVTVTLTDAGGTKSTFCFTLDVRRVLAHDDETIYIEPQGQTGLVREVKRSGSPVAEILQGDVTFQPRGFNNWQPLHVPDPVMPADMHWRLVLHKPDATGKDTKTYLSGIMNGMDTVTWNSRSVADGTYALTYEFVQGSANPDLDITRYIERPMTVIIDNVAGAVTGAQWLPVTPNVDDGYRNRWRGPMEAIQWVRYTSPSDKHTAHPYPYSFATPPTTDAGRQALVDTANLVAETWLGPLNNRYTTEAAFVQAMEGHPFTGSMTWNGLDTSYLPFTKRFAERDGSRNNAAVNTITQFRPVPGSNPSLIGIGIEGRVVRIDPRETGDGLVKTIAGWVVDPSKLPYYDDAANYDNAKRLVGSFEADLLFRMPTDLAIDPANTNIAYVADAHNHRIARVDLTTGSVTTFAGDMTFRDAYSVPIPGYRDGSRLVSRFNNPASLEIIGRTMYVADRLNNAVRAINLDTGMVTTVLGRGPGAPTVPSDTVLAQNREAWTFARISFDNSPIAYPLWVRQDSRGNLLVQEFGAEGRGTSNLRRMEFATREVAQLRQTFGASFEVDYRGRIGPVDDIIVQHIPQTSALGRLASDGTVRGNVTALGAPLYYGRGESNPLMTEGGAPYGVQAVIDDQEAKLGFTSVYRSSFTVLRPRLPSDPSADHDATLYDEGRAVDIAGTVLSFYPNESRPSFAALHGRFGHNWLGSTATFDDLVSKSDAELAQYIQAGMGSGVARPELTGKDLHALIYFIRLSSLQGKLETIDPTEIANNLRQAGYWPDDTRQPEIRNVQVVPVDGSTVKIKWDTDEPTIGLVSYGLTSYYGMTSNIEAGYSTHHEITLSQLMPDATLHFLIQSKDKAGNQTITNDASFECPNAFKLKRQSSNSSGSAAQLKAKQLKQVVGRAVDWWQARGLSESQLDAIQNVQFVIADLPDKILGLAMGNVIWIDQNAAGKGWWAGKKSSDWSKNVDEALQRVDLLTVVVHELGHVIGAEHSEDLADVMYESLAPGERRV
jgi:hypothetical protein